MRACDVIKNKLPSTSSIDKDDRYINYLIISSIANKKTTCELIAKHIALNLSDNSFVDEEALSFYLNINFDSNGKEEYAVRLPGKGAKDPVHLSRTEDPDYGGLRYAYA